MIDFNSNYMEFMINAKGMPYYSLNPKDLFLDPTASIHDILHVYDKFNDHVRRNLSTDSEEYRATAMKLDTSGEPAVVAIYQYLRSNSDGSFGHYINDLRNPKNTRFRAYNYIPKKEHK